MKTIKNGIRGYDSEFDREPEYYEKIEMPVISDYRDMLRFKDRNTALFDKRWQAACEVIDIIADKVGLDPKDACLYCVQWDHMTKTASSPIADKIDEWFNKSGDKAKLKKRIAELENENNVFRSVIGK